MFGKIWMQAIQAYFQPKMLAMMSLGFASGLPFMLIYSELAFWMKKEDVDLAVIGFFSWIGLAYTFKVLWAPLVDRIEFPGALGALGQRRSWMLFAIIGTIAGMLIIASSDPSQNITRLALGCLLYTSPSPRDRG